MIRQMRIPLVAAAVLLTIAAPSLVESGFYLVAGGKNYQNLVVVAKSGSPFSSVQAALDSISGADEDNPHLIFIAPGVYSGRFTMVPWVDIAGSGQGATFITSGGGANYYDATVKGADNCELRDLTVVNTGGAAWAVAVVVNHAALRLSRVTLKAQGGSNHTYVLLADAASSAVLEEVTLDATGSGATYAAGLALWSGAEVRGNNLKITAQGGTHCYGVAVEQSSLLLRNSVIKASGGANNTSALDNITDSQAEVTGSRLEAVCTTGPNPWAVTNSDADLTLRQCTAIADGATGGGALNHQSGGDVVAEDCTLQGEDWGVNSEGTGSKAAVTRLHHCRIKGSMYTVTNGVYSSMYLSHCRLDGGTALGSPTCAGCSDENYAFSASTCP